MAETYDVIVIGGGPAGLTAALYAARAGRRVAVVERETPGGKIVNADRVEDYPGFPEGAKGADLGAMMWEQATAHGVEVVFAEVEGFEAQEGLHVAHTSEGDYRGRAAIIACGSEPLKLGVPGEDEFTGRGVSYCAVCDAGFFEGEPVAVIGGGDSAIDEGLYLTHHASQVTVVHRRDQLRAIKVLQERALANDKLNIQWNSAVEEITGNGKVTGIRVRDLRTNANSVLDVAGVFVYVGFRPNTDLFQGLVAMDSGGHVLANPWMETEVPGLFVAGDVRQHSARQVASAVGDGATAAIAAERYLGNIGR